MRSRPTTTPEPEIRYPAELPITERLDDLRAAFREHQVVVVAGETGSGKSTQIPKLCLELAAGRPGLVGHTQPRRIAARAVAERVAEELDTPLGGLVGYSIRFHDQVGKFTRIRVMTDGLLLAELQRDPDLRRYHTIIVDEAHERSLNVDFLLGYLAALLPRRPDLHVVITSATIDTARFSEHFGNAPVIEVSGRTYPVDIRYRAPDPGVDQADAICDAVVSLCREGPGDLLVFCSGEREIRDTADALTSSGRLEPGTEVLALYGRLSAADQHKVFQPHRGRRVVIATNVAETSITVPGVRFVIDPGTARISRYSRRTKVQRLPIEPISQASANQRSGRCGRLGPGIAVRLYDEADFDARPRFTDPEIRRTNLASVLLQMAALGLGDVESFPFVDPPDAAAVRDGNGLLEELGAVVPDLAGDPDWLTPIGRRLARLPVDPRLGRMLLAADEWGAVREVQVIAAALSIQDPREYPSENDAAARTSHARFIEPTSDFLGVLRLWEYLAEQRRERSGNQFRKLCRSEFLHSLRVREWQDLVAQLDRTCREMGIRRNDAPASPEAIHRSLLSGMLSHIGLRDDESSGARSADRSGRNDGRTRRERSAVEYRGARGTRFRIARGSALASGGPRWVMAAELVETNRLWARTAVGVQPAWIEAAAEHLVRRTYDEPEWSSKSGAAMSIERVLLFGLPLVAGRRVPTAKIDAEAARWLFVLHALVEGDWHARWPFCEHNARTIVEADRIAAKARGAAGDIDPEALAHLLAERLPPKVTSVAMFDRWWTRTARDHPHLLDLTVEQVLGAGAAALDPDAYPDEYREGHAALALDYRFEPGDEDDGVDIEVPIAMLNQLRRHAIADVVPGRRGEIVEALLRTLPKSLRKQLVPIPDSARDIDRRLASMGEPVGDLLVATAAQVGRLLGSPVDPASFDPTRIPLHLLPRYVVVDEAGARIDADRDLSALRDRLDGAVRESVTATSASHDLTRTGLRSPEFEALPASVTTRTGGIEVRAFPALVDEGDTFGVALFPSEDEQFEQGWAGTRRLILCTVPGPGRDLTRGLSPSSKLAIAATPWRTEARLVADLTDAVLDEFITAGGGPARTPDAASALIATARRELTTRCRAEISAVATLVDAAAALTASLAESAPAALLPGRADIAEHLDRLVYDGCLAAVGVARIADLMRYVVALEHRLARLPRRVDADAAATGSLRRLEAEVDRAAASIADPVAVEGLHWMLEELRVATFAEQVGTREPVSETRVRKATQRAVAGQPIRSGGHG